jgi:hypothetical protein
MTWLNKCIAVLCLSLATAGAAAGQQAPQAGADDPAISPAELQRMFDAYALLQAQEQLRLNDDTYSRFLARFKALQDLRRRTLMERTQRVMELQRLGRDPNSDERSIRERLDALREFDKSAADDVAKAYAAVDQVLDVRQQAQFRAFEEVMERRKLDLISRARQKARPAARPNARPRQPM